MLGAGLLQLRLHDDAVRAHVALARFETFDDLRHVGVGASRLDRSRSEAALFLHEYSARKRRHLNPHAGEIRDGEQRLIGDALAGVHVARSDDAGDWRRDRIDLQAFIALDARERLSRFDVLAERGGDIARALGVRGDDAVQSNRLAQVRRARLAHFDAGAPGRLSADTRNLFAGLRPVLVFVASLGWVVTAACSSSNSC